MFNLFAFSASPAGLEGPPARQHRFGPSPAPIWLLLILLLAAPGTARGQATLLSPFGSQPGTLSSCDDCNLAVPLTDVFSNGIQFGAATYTELYISTNGYITFGHGNSGYSPQGIAAYTQGPIVAVQYDDLDPAKGGQIWYHQNTSSNYVMVTYENVAPFSAPAHGSGTNTLQIVLRRIGPAGSTDFQIELRYHRLSWTRSGNNSAWPTAGWSAGNQSTYGEVDLSGSSLFHQLVSGTNDKTTGVYRWNVEGGIVESTPTVNQTSAVSAIGATTAQSGGNVSSDGNSGVVARGLVWSTSALPTLSDNSVVSGSGLGSFSATMNGLASGTTYYVRAFATNALGTAYGPQRSFTTLSQAPPTVVTSTPSAISTSSAQAGGNVTSDGGVSVSARGIAWGTSPNPTLSANVETAGSGTGSFTTSLSGLAPGTTYHVRAWATNSLGTSFGSNATFTTLVAPATVTTGSASAITATGAEVSGEVTDVGGGNISSRGVVWSSSPTPTTADVVAAAGTGGGAFVATLVGLDPGGTVYARAFAANEAGTVYGDEISFDAAFAPAEVTLPVISSIEARNAVAEGEVTYEGGGAVSARGFVYALSPDPTLDNAVAASDSGPGVFAAPLEGLLPNSTYHVRAFATNQVGTAYGPAATFTTLVEPGTAVTHVFSSVTTTSAQVGGEATYDGGGTILARGIVYGTSPNPTTADMVAGAGGGLGAFSMELSNLIPGVGYHFRAFVTNEAGTAYGAPRWFMAGRLSQVVTFEGPGELRYGDTPATVSPTSSSGITPTIVSSDTSIVQVAGHTLSIRGAGTVQLTATAGGSPTYNASEPVSLTIEVLPLSVSGSFEVAVPKIHDGTTLAQVVGRAVHGVLPQDEGQVALSGGTAHFVDPEVGSGKIAHLQGAVLVGTRAVNYLLAEVVPATGQIVADDARSLSMAGPSNAVAGETSGRIVVTLRDNFGNAATADADVLIRLSVQQHATTARFLDRDGTPLPDGVLPLWRGDSIAVFHYANRVVGEGQHRLVATPNPASTDISQAPATHDLQMGSAGFSGFQIILPEWPEGTGPVAGDEMVVTLQAVDVWGNPIPDFTGTASVVGSGPLAKGGGLTPAFTGGRLSGYVVAFADAGSFTLTVSAEVSGALVSATTDPIDVRRPHPRIRIEILTDTPRPALGDIVLLTVRVVNEGSSAAEELRVRNPLAYQTRLELLESTPSMGSLEGLLGDWMIQRLEAGAEASLVLRARVQTP